MGDKEKLIQLKQLLDGEIITQEEFDAKKRQILKLELPVTESKSEEVKKTSVDNKANEKAVSDATSTKYDNQDLKRNREALIGRNTEYYIPRFENIDKGGGSWNWCGFFFSPIWFAYRKLYGWAAIAFIGPFLVGIGFGLIIYSTSISESVSDIISRALQLAINIAFATTANSIYKKRIDKLVSEMPQDLDSKQRFIQSKGDVNFIAMIITIVLYVGILILSYS